MLLKKYKLVLVVVYFVFIGQVYSQTVINYYETKIGQASDNTFTQGEPAQFIATYPKNDTISNSILINGYIDAGWVREREGYRQKLSFAYEVQRNNLVTKEQDVRQFGFVYSSTISDMIAVPQPPGSAPGFQPKESALNYNVSASIKYSYDDIKDEGGMQAIAGLTLDRMRHRDTSLNAKDRYYFLNTLEKFPRDTTDFARVMRFSHNHNIGIGYIDNENALLGNLEFQFNVYPLSQILKETFDQDQLLFLSYNYSARAEFLGKLESDIRPYRTLSMGLEYTLNDNSTFQLSYNSIKGSNPYKGLDYQDYNTLAFKVKLAIDSKPK